MDKSSSTAKEKKGVAWYIPPRLRHWLNSHASYLSAIGKETATDEMVVEWLKERVKIEERKRDVRALERAMEKQDDEVVDSDHESGKEKVRRDPRQTDSSGTGKAVRGKTRKKT